MPCGGIFPMEPVVSTHPEGQTCSCCCWTCSKHFPPPDHFLIEWDAFIHGKCVEAFLKTDEGKIVLDHKHAVIVLGEDGIERTVHEGVG